MSAAIPARRFHEEGVGSRTGLRIGAVERDADGNEDLDAFFAESKRVLDWMEQSDDDEDVGDDSGGGSAVDARTGRTERTPEAVQDEWGRRVSRISALATHSLGDADATHASTSRANDSMWESSVDVSAVRPFNLTELAGDTPTPRHSRTRRSTLPPPEDVSWLRDATRSSSRTDTPRGRSVSVDTEVPEPLDVSRFTRDSLTPRRDSVYGTSMWDDTRIDRSSVTPQSVSRPPSLDAFGSRASSVAESRASSVDPAPLAPLEPLMEPYADDTMSEPASDLYAPPVAPVRMPEPPKKRGRGRPRKSETLRAMAAAGLAPPRGRPGRPPGRQMPPQKIVEQIHDPPSWQLNNPEGLRRGRRHRIAPLDWWRGERALYGRADAPDDAPTLPFGLVAPVLKKVVRVPRAPGEGTFSGMRRFKAKPALMLPERVASAAPPEQGMDRDTDPYGVVYDAEQGDEVTMRIACNAQSLRPRPAFNRQFLYEKVFSLGDFMAAGLLVIPQGGEKQAKSSKDNNYFVIAPGGMFCVPMGNTYNIRNVSERDARIFFAQARNMYAPLTPVVREGQTVFSHGDALRAVHDLHGDRREEDVREEDETRSDAPVRADGGTPVQADDDEAYEDELGTESEDDDEVSDDEYDISRDSRASRR
ncbi:MIF2 [Malassezia furfur]|nr:MIF2 [Malassezia furfur]